MRLLCVHAESLAFDAREQARADEHVERDGVPMDGHMSDCVVVFVGVEPSDGAEVDGVVDAALPEIAGITNTLDTTRVVLYPSGHLIDDVAAPETTDTVIDVLETTLRDRGYDLLRAPDSWYKHVDLSAKGHRFARRSFRVTAGSDGGRAADTSEWVLVFPDGTRVDAATASSEVGELMATFVEHEIADGGPTPDVEAGHLAAMQESGFADFTDDSTDVATTDGSETETAIYYPRGTFVRDAVREFLSDRTVEYGAMPVETVSDAGVGSITAMQAMDISASDLPLKLAELTADPTIQTVTANGDQAREEMRRQLGFVLRTTEALGLTAHPVVRVLREFYENHEAWVQQVVRDLARPVLLEILSEQQGSWTVAVELPTVDSDGQPIVSPAVTLGVESTQRHDITSTDGDGSHSPVMLHCSLAGELEHIVAALVVNARRMETPRLPTWLSPTQVRLIPAVPEEHLSVCDAFADELAKADIRVDVDDRTETVGHRIESARRDWVPYYAVVGDDEQERGTLNVTDRTADRDTEMTSGELREQVLDESEGLPQRRRYLPRHLSDYPAVVNLLQQSGSAESPSPRSERSE